MRGHALGFVLVTALTLLAGKLPERLPSGQSGSKRGKKEHCDEHYRHDFRHTDPRFFLEMLAISVASPPGSGQAAQGPLRLPGKRPKILLDQIPIPRGNLVRAGDIELAFREALELTP